MLVLKAFTTKVNFYMVGSLLLYKALGLWKWNFFFIIEWNTRMSSSIAWIQLYRNCMHLSYQVVYNISQIALHNIKWQQPANNSSSRLPIFYEPNKERKKEHSR